MWRTAIAIATGAVAATSAVASTDPASIATSAYARASVADALGQLQDSATGYGTALAMEPGDTMLALRTLRQALAAGDRPLAVRAARILDAAGKLPADGRLLLVADAVAMRDWGAARTAVDVVERERIFGFMVPSLRAWIAFGAHDGDPLASLDPAPVSGSAGAIATAPSSPYAAEQRALLFLALGRTDEGVAAVRALATASVQSGRLRLFAAAALQRDRQKDKALALLAGDDALLAMARQRVAAGKRLVPQPFGAADGMAEFFLRVAADVQQQRVTPLAIGFARIATFLSPHDDAAWLATGALLAEAGKPQAALAALANIAPTDLLADPARAQRLRLLVAEDDRPAALAEIQAEVAQPGATLAQWMRAGDLYQDLDRQVEAVQAFSRALALAEAQGAGKDDLWPILLLLGGAQEQSGDWAAARRTLSRTLELAPEQAVVLNYLGYAKLERREDLAAARALIERASKLRPDDPSITDSLGWSYYLTGDTAKAVATLERAAQGDPAQSTINEHLGDAYWTAGRRYEARYAWRAALVQADEKAAGRIRGKIDAGLSSASAAP